MQGSRWAANQAARSKGRGSSSVKAGAEHRLRTWHCKSWKIQQTHGGLCPKQLTSESEAMKEKRQPSPMLLWLVPLPCPRLQPRSSVGLIHAGPLLADYSSPLLVNACLSLTVQASQLSSPWGGAAFSSGIRVQLPHPTNQAVLLPYPSSLVCDFLRNRDQILFILPQGAPSRASLMVGRQSQCISPH